MLPKNYQERKRMMKKGAYLLSTLLFLSFIASALFGDSGILINMRVKTEHDQLVIERDALLAENARLAREIRELKSNPRKIEELGRKDFGFGKPGEIIFFFPPDPDAAVERYSQDAAKP